MSDATNLDQTLAHVVDKLSSLASAHAGDAAMLGGRVVQMKVLSNMLWPIFLLALATPVAITAYRLGREYFRREASKEHGHKDNDAWAIGSVVCSVIASTLGLIGLIGFMVNDLSALNWAVLVDYRIGLAAKVLGLL